MASQRISSEKDNLPNNPKHKGWRSYLFTGIAAVFSIYHVYYGGFGTLGGYRLGLVHLGLMCLIGFLAYTLKGDKNIEKDRLYFFDLCLGLTAVVCCAYILIEYEELQFRIETPLDITVGVAILLLVIEGTRRVSGIIIPAIVSAFALYTFLGPHLPSAIAHRGASLDMFIHYAIYTTEGVFGVPLVASATFIVLFIIFSAFLKESGTGDFFINISYSLFGGMRGGPAKCAVVGSGLFGCISGSAVANVVSTGSFTIPLMHRIGYSPIFSGAIEAVASTGGQLMPPIMGAAAFLMSEILSISYLSIIKMAALPAIIYYLSLFIMVDTESLRMNIRGIPRKELPMFFRTFKEGWLLFFPIVVLLYMLIWLKYSPMKSGYGAIIAVLVFSSLKKTSRMSLKQVLKALEDGALATLQVALICASAGIIICCMTISGLGMKISSFLVHLSGGSMIALLIFAMVASIILGMGMPTTASYIVVSILVAPSLVKMGMLPIAAHLFVFYFAVVSNITPPVCLAAYAAAGISGADQFKTGFSSVRIGVAGFLIPFLFVYNQPLLMKGSVVGIMGAFIAALVGITALGCGLRGFLLLKLSLLNRLLMVLIALSVVNPAFMLLRWIGCGLFLAILIGQIRRSRRLHLEQ